MADAHSPFHDLDDYVAIPRMTGLRLSPDGSWLLVTWPTANQWVFLHGSHVQAVGNIREQFPRADHLGPVIELSGRWCCSS